VAISHLYMCIQISCQVKKKAELPEAPPEVMHFHSKIESLITIFSSRSDLNFSPTRTPSHLLGNTERSSRCCRALRVSSFLDVNFFGNVRVIRRAFRKPRS